MKRTLAILVLSTLFAVTACGNYLDAPALGSYYQEDGVLCLTIEDGKSFIFSNMLLSSWPAAGAFSLENGKLLLLTNNNKYVFDIRDHALVFQKPASSLDETEEYSGFEQLEDGMVFLLSD